MNSLVKVGLAVGLVVVAASILAWIALRSPDADEDPAPRSGPGASRTEEPDAEAGSTDGEVRKRGMLSRLWRFLTFRR